VTPPPERRFPDRKGEQGHKIQGRLAGKKKKGGESTIEVTQNIPPRRKEAILEKE